MTTKQWLLELLEAAREKEAQRILDRVDLREIEILAENLSHYNCARRLVEQGPEEPQP